jgi:signal transduction histidine kinase
MLQTAITVGLALLSWSLYQRYRRPYYALWALAWVCYSARLGAIMRFLVTHDLAWLYWHQVLTGWTALALLWSALAFSMRLTRHRWWIVASIFPPAWSYLAIYRFDSFLSAAIPAVLFLTAATLATAAVFARHWREVRAPGALVLWLAFALWGLHHLDYPFLRARGAWVPWGYYLDILFTLAAGAGMLLLVMDDLQQGIRAFSTLAVSGAAEEDGDVARQTIKRPLSLPAVRGAALFTVADGVPQCVAGDGACSGWEAHPIAVSDAAMVSRAISSARVQSAQGAFQDPVTGHRYAFAAVLPLFATPDPDRASSALVIVGDARDPFTALDEGFLLALGHQAGRAIERDELRRRLLARTVELQRLSTRMVAQHEDERRRLALELHDETAQLFAAVSLQLGLIRERAGPALGDDLAEAQELVAEGMRSVRRVTHDLRPALLDDLGLVPALRALAGAAAERSGLQLHASIDDDLQPIPVEAEAALYRALQELLTNVVRHAGARSVTVQVAERDGTIALSVDDDGRGFPGGIASPPTLPGHTGLSGMRERIEALGGTVRFGASPLGGARAIVELASPARVPS